MTSESKLSFVTVIVTYGSESRFSGVVQTIDSAFKAGTSKIFLVNNGCSYDLKAKLTDKSNIEKVRIKHFEQNEGSEVGFSAGLQMVVEDTTILPENYVLVLDDDVRVNENFLSSYEKIEKNLNLTQKHIWSLFRMGRDHTFDTEYDRNKNFYKNSIAGFSIFRKNIESLTKRRGDISIPYFIPWAGTWLRKLDLEKIKMPSSNFFVYEDDAEFSLNVREQGYEIFKSRKMMLQESSKSWFEDEKKQKSGYRIFYENERHSGRFLYMIRNNVFLIKNRLMTNKTLFYINIWIFVLVGFVKYGKISKSGFLKLRELCGAITAGLHEQLGKNGNWEL